MNFEPALFVLGSNEGPFLQQHLHTAWAGAVGDSVVQGGQGPTVLQVRGHSQVQQGLKIQGVEEKCIDLVSKFMYWF